MAESLQKQEEEMMDSSPDPMDMEVCLTKIRHKVVGAIYTLLQFSAVTLAALKALYQISNSSFLLLHPDYFLVFTLISLCQICT